MNTPPPYLFVFIEERTTTLNTFRNSSDVKGINNDCHGDAWIVERQFFGKKYKFIEMGVLLQNV